MSSTQNCLKWKIFWAILDPVQGSEQAGQRPVLIISNDIVNESLPVVTVLPLTTLKPGRTVYPTEAKLDAKENGLAENSLAMAHQIRTISKSRLDNQCGEITLQTVKESVEQALRTHLEL